MGFERFSRWYGGSVVLSVRTPAAASASAASAAPLPMVNTKSGLRRASASGWHASRAAPAPEEERASSSLFRGFLAEFFSEVSAFSGPSSAGGVAGKSTVAAGDATVALDASVAVVSSHDAPCRVVVCASSAANGSKASLLGASFAARAAVAKDAPSRPSIQSTVRWNHVVGGSPAFAATRRSRHADFMRRLKVFVTIWPA